ncbi:hypothetical protein PoB_006553700 [Plakobranchus ocellatus]|uniref:PiggyBac transposable element-derived protein 4 C-terminal zinc-ribbon domain-containing protein n=1 Tax=Plakobranchus ocellatus TaxID=259542 RepID=A0AAV4D4A6_9GAST|nr:hypothetical protein PoB_006553700 [Plakobranchus ocellatus]
MKPQLERRQAITNLPRYTKTLVDIALEPYSLDAAQAQEQVSMARKRGRCIMCPRRREVKTPLRCCVCNFCKNSICSKHSTKLIICAACQN